MKLCAVALDYDGTIAREGRVEPLVIEAVKEAQARKAERFRNNVSVTSSYSFAF